MRGGTVGVGLLLVLFMFLFIFEPLPVHASKPIVFDSSATNNCAGCTSLSWSHTVGSGSNGILIVGLSGFKNDPATSVTFGTKSLSLVGNHLGFANVNVELWALLNPSSACAPSPPPCTATVTVTITGGNILAGGSVSYFNVGGTGTVASADDGGIQGTTGSVTVSSSNSGDLVVDALGAYNNVATVTASQGSGQSQRWNTGSVHPIAIAFFVGGGSDKPDSPPVTMTWSFSPSSYWSLIAVPLTPVGPVSVQVPCATGLGTVTFTMSPSTAGGFTSLTASTLSSISPAPPAGLTFPCGLFSFTITGLVSGAIVTVTVTMPVPLPAGTFSYWKFQSGAWTQFPSASLDSTRMIITLTLTASAGGTVTDPGGPAITPPKLAVSHVPVGGVMLPSVGFTVVLPWAIVLSLLGVLSVEAFTIKRRAKRR